MTALPFTAEHTFEAIRSRRSIGLKQMEPAPIDLGQIELMLEAANWAPSHGKTEPWRFTVYSGDARRGLGEAFAAAYRELNPGDSYDAAAEAAQRDRVWQASVWISLGMRPSPKMPEWEELIAFGCAVQNAHLMASALGLGCKWTSGACSVHRLVARFVGLEEGERLLGFLYVGRPAIPWPEGKRRPLAEKVRWITE